MSAAALLVVAGLVTGSSALAFDLEGSDATFAWQAAPGSVDAYGVWLAWNGETFSEPLGPPDFIATDPVATVEGGYGETFQMRVAANYGGVYGPASEASIAIRFTPPPVVPLDLDGNGAGDAIFQLAGGSLAAWLMTSDGPWLQDHLPPHSRFDPETWQLAGSTDANDDGRSDILWSHAPSGSAELWLTEGTRVAAVLPVATRGPGWMPHMMTGRSMAGAIRILWLHQPSGVTELWELFIENGELVIDRDAELLAMSASQQWRIVGSCDVNGDRLDDVIWHDAASGSHRLWLMGSLSVSEESMMYIASEEFVGCADFDGEGMYSLVRESATDKRYSIWSYTHKDVRGYAAGTTRRVFRGKDQMWKLILASDLDGDGFADLFEWSPTKRKLRIRPMVEAAVVKPDVVVLPLPTGQTPVSMW